MLPSGTWSGELGPMPTEARWGCGREIAGPAGGEQPGVISVLIGFKQRRLRIVLCLPL